MKKIQLTKGKYALVDDSDFESINKFNWCVNGSYKSNVLYAVRSSNHRLVRMHRQILGVSRGQEIDHIDGDGLNNQRHNLRICTRQENLRNQLKYKNNKSGFKGVNWKKDRKKWRACATFNKKSVFLGYFNSPEEAHRAYNDFAIKNYNGFHRIK